jgi:hypothetical protein
MSDNQFIQKTFDGAPLTNEAAKEVRELIDRPSTLRYEPERLPERKQTVLTKLPDTPQTGPLPKPSHISSLEKGTADRLAQESYAAGQAALATNPVQYIHVTDEYSWYLGDSSIGVADVVVLRLHSGEGVERLAYRLYSAWLKRAAA